MEHTKGPWKYREDYSQAPYITSSGGVMLADVSLAYIPEEEGRGNGVLMASAPELLDACRLALTLNGNPRRDNDDEAEWAMVISFIRAAIAKAEGR